MKETLSKIVFLIVDLAAIAISISLAYYLRNFVALFDTPHAIPLSKYMGFFPIYVVILTIFTYEGIYTRRYDFWHETRLVIKALFFSFIIVLAYLALSKTIENYSRAVIIFSFLIMMFFIPLLKRVTKLTLYKMKIWQKPAAIYGKDILLHNEIYANPYLGYIEAKNQEPKTIFINSRDMNHSSLKQIIDEQIRTNHEVIFIPLLNDFDLTQSQIYELSNIRTNLISLQNRLKSRYRRTLKYIFDYLFALLILPFLLPILAFIGFLIKKEEPNGTILFKQARLGKDGKAFICYKFRTMKENGEELLKAYLDKNPEEVDYYNTYHKYKNDPRVTKIGAFLRKTSLDELPQIFNIIKGEMSFVGPRPYMLNEKEKIGNKLETILKVRPGITGLWQVSGRSEVDFFDRIDMDVWYIRNWNLWMDIVILTKTVKAVLIKEGAY
ncbi:MAG: exopolysaccharide biosynthesis polyprenyl glycosylphosphotransferase [Hydrogenimonas sp.]|nr:exopolysaccharide biosynthesis polyprenyl glycosylphosphotransferase [Hydrogenimonas sp.]